MNASKPVAPIEVGHDHPRWMEPLLDGSRIGIRPVSPLDATAERVFIEALSPQTRRYRFMGQVGHPGSDLVAQFAHIDYKHQVAFAAVVPEVAKECFVGVSRYSTSPDGASCECAVTVLDGWQHKGVGSALMKHLIEVARSHGVLYMFSVDASDNAEMAEFARYLGFSRKIDTRDATLAIHGLWL